MEKEFLEWFEKEFNTQALDEDTLQWHKMIAYKAWLEGQKSQWISVEDGLPEPVEDEDIIYLWALRHGQAYPAFYVPEDNECYNKGFYELDEDSSPRVMFDVTHYQLKSEPPKE